MTTATLPQISPTIAVEKLAYNAEVFGSVADATGGHASVIEPKFDGWRLLVNIVGTGELDDEGREVCETRTYTRSGKPKTGHLVVIESELAKVFPAGTWLDAEVVAFHADEFGNIHHGWGSVQSMMGGNPKPLAAQEKATLVVFDLMAHGGIDARSQPFRNRRNLLKMIFDSADIDRVILSPQFEATEELHQQNLDAGFEGSMVKWLDAPYRSGVRGHGMGKLKPQETADAEVIGFKEGQGSWAGIIGAVVVGMKDDFGKLVEVARFSGFDFPERVHISENRELYLGRIVEFKHHGVMSSGGYRHPQFSRWRDEEKTEADSLPVPVSVEALAPAKAVEPKAAPAFSTELFGTGRSGSGKLRNFKAMSDEKFAGVLADVLAEDNDPDAIEAVQAEEVRRHA